MFADTRQRCGSLERTGWRVAAAVWVAGLVAVLVGWLLTAAPASAATAKMFTQSAKGGELQGGRLTLHGVSGRVTYVLNTGRRGTLSVRRLHRRQFLPGLPATGTLHVAGYRGGDEPSFRLSKPRRNAARHTVSYRVKRLDDKPLPSGAARAAGFRPPRRFGAASLSIVPHPRLTGGDNGGNDCAAAIYNSMGFDSDPLNLVSSSNWPTDTWEQQPIGIGTGGSLTVESDGGSDRGCHWEAVWTIDSATISMEVTWPWGQLPSSSCSTTEPVAHPCRRQDQNGTITWYVGEFPIAFRL
jgi:hypothetical protein